MFLAIILEVFWVYVYLVLVNSVRARIFCWFLYKLLNFHCGLMFLYVIKWLDWDERWSYTIFKRTEKKTIPYDLFYTVLLRRSNIEMQWVKFHCNMHSRKSRITYINLKNFISLKLNSAALKNFWHSQYLKMFDGITEPLVRWQFQWNKWWISDAVSN